MFNHKFINLHHNSIIPQIFFDILSTNNENRLSVKIFIELKFGRQQQ